MSPFLATLSLVWTGLYGESIFVNYTPFFNILCIHFIIHIQSFLSQHWYLGISNVLSFLKILLIVLNFILRNEQQR